MLSCPCWGLCLVKSADIAYRTCPPTPRHSPSACQIYAEHLLSGCQCPVLGSVAVLRQAGWPIDNQTTMCAVEERGSKPHLERGGVRLGAQRARAAACRAGGLSDLVPALQGL